MRITCRGSRPPTCRRRCRSRSRSWSASASASAAPQPAATSSASAPARSSSRSSTASSGCIRDPADRERVAANDEAIALYRELDRTLQVRVAQKVALRSDALDVQFRLAQEELTRTNAQNTLASQKEQLNQLLGRDVRTPFDVEDVRRMSLVESTSRRRSQRAREPARRREARLKLQQAELDRPARRRPSGSPRSASPLSYSSNFNIDVLPTNWRRSACR